MRRRPRHFLSFFPPAVLRGLPKPQRRFAPRIPGGRTLRRLRVPPRGPRTGGRSGARPVFATPVGVSPPGRAEAARPEVRVYRPAPPARTACPPAGLVYRFVSGSRVEDFILWVEK